MMEFEDLKRISISNLILIILNDKKDDNLRKSAEFELKKRIRNVGWKYDDLLHFDDKVIKKRGLDIDNYLISPKINMQQLMETYFMYDNTTDYDDNYLLFSEKHLCNVLDLKEPFFREICAKEIKNIDERIKTLDVDVELTQLLLSIKTMLEQRNKKTKQAIIDTKKNWGISEVLCVNDAMYQLEGGNGCCHEFLYNVSEEEIFNLFSSKRGMIKIAILNALNDSLFDTDIMQYLYGLIFIRKDSAKLNSQKRQLLQQIKNGYQVDYQTDTMRKALQRSRH